MCNAVQRTDNILLHILGFAIVKAQQQNKAKSHLGGMHMNNERIQEIINNMTSFENKEYHKSEMLDEMMKLQSELVNMTFNGNHAENAELKIYDVERHLQQLNEQQGNVADEKLARFMNGCKTLCNLIKAEISGRRGEYRAFKALDYLVESNSIIKNVELKSDELRTEIDAVVLTKRCIYLIEVKNTSRNIYISENGKYYRNGEFLKLDCDIAYKMSVKEQLLREAISKAGITDIKIQKVIVFTDERIEVHNRYKEIKTCFSSQLTNIVDCFGGQRIYSLEDIAKMCEAIQAAACKECYPADFDVDQFKLDFAILMDKLERAQETESENVDVNITVNCAESDCEEKAVKEEKGRSFVEILDSVVSSKAMRYAGLVAAGVALPVVIGISAFRYFNHR